MNDIVSYIRWRFSINKFCKAKETENFRGKIPLQEMPRLNSE